MQSLNPQSGMEGKNKTCRKHLRVRTGVLPRLAASCETTSKNVSFYPKRTGGERRELLVKYQIERKSVIPVVLHARQAAQNRHNY